MCCKVMGVPGVKAEHQWCPHAMPGKGGCKIYAQRPERCRDFLCQWLLDDRYPEYWYPRVAKIVIDMKLIDGKTYVAFVVDPAYPRRWLEPPYIDDIKTIARAGLESREWRTIISIRGDNIPITLEPPIKLVVTPTDRDSGVLAP
jgi:hypothetical protein